MPFSFNHDAANSSENGIVSGDNNRAPYVSQKQQQNNDYQDDALVREVDVQHRPGGMVETNSSRSIKRNDFTPAGKNVIVQLVNLACSPIRAASASALCASAQSRRPRRRYL